MKITIIFNDNMSNIYNSFDEIIKLDNYNEIIYIYCRYNNLSSLPQLPNSLKELFCAYNNLKELPELPNSLEYLQYHNNPICEYIKKYFDDDWKQYREFQHKVYDMTMKVFANKIGGMVSRMQIQPRI